jgi:hypothetical protein
MKVPAHPLRVVVAVALTLFGLVGGPPAGGQGSDIITTFARLPTPIVPLHHFFIYFTNNLDGCESTQGYYILFQVNNDRTSTQCPETICVDAFVRNLCSRGALPLGRAGTTSGSIVLGRSGPWYTHEYAFDVRNTFTVIIDAARDKIVATGYSRMQGSVGYWRTAPNDPADRRIYSVLGPIAHAFEFPNVALRNFRFVMQAQGSGPSLLVPGTTARWSLSNAFLQNGDFGVGSFQITPR